VNENAKFCCVATPQPPAAKLRAPDGPGGQFTYLRSSRGAEMVEMVKRYKKIKKPFFCFFFCLNRFVNEMLGDFVEL
jgi:hypothetical protein